MAKQLSLNLLALGYSRFHQGRKLDPQQALYLESVGRPPENKYSDTEWPVGPVKAKRRAQEIIDAQDTLPPAA